MDITFTILSNSNYLFVLIGGIIKKAYFTRVSQYTWDENDA
jgi:hypothetical protein